MTTRVLYGSRVVRFAVTVTLATTLLLPSVSGAAAIVSNPFPIAATAAKEISFGGAFDGTNFLLAIQGNAVSGTAITAQLVSAIGAMVGGRIDTGRTGSFFLSFKAAFDGANFLVAWKDATGGLYGQFIGTDGSLVGTPFVVAAAPVYDLQGLGQGGGAYVAAYARDEGGQLLGKIIQPNGTIGSEFPISSAGVKNAYGVAFDGASFLIPWTNHDDGLVRGRFVSTAGVLLGTEFTIDDSPAPSDNPGGVAFDGANYLVAWMDYVADGNWDLFGRLVSPSGAFASSRFAISEAAGAQFVPTVMAGAGKWLVVWTDLTNDENLNWQCDAAEGTCWDVHGRYFDPDGTPRGGPFPISTAPHNQFGAVAAFGGEAFLCVVDDFGDASFDGPTGDVFGVLVTEDATPVVTVVATDPAAAEKDGNHGTFALARTGATTDDLVVGYTLAGTAALGADYILAPAPVGSLTIPAGAASAAVTLAPLDDIAPESVETARLVVEAGTGYAPGLQGSATVSIISNDPKISLPAALDLPGGWKTGGAARWYGQKSATHDGRDAAGTDVLSYGQRTWLQLSVKGPATLSFWWRTTADATDALKFSIDGKVKAALRGQHAWQRKSFAIGEGNHVLKWVFKRGPSGWMRANAAVVDQVTVAR